MYAPTIQFREAQATASIRETVPMMAFAIYIFLFLRNLSVKLYFGSKYLRNNIKKPMYATTKIYSPFKKALSMKIHLSPDCSN